MSGGTCRPGDWDVAIVGGGPAGLAAALVLARSCRRVVLLDAGRPRNAPSRAAHNFLTREGVPPAELRRLAREEVREAGAELVDAEVTGALRADGGFRLLTGEVTIEAPKLLLATGLRDIYPNIPGLHRLLGLGVYTCPYCDGREHRGRPLAVLGNGQDGPDVALGLTTWSDDVILCTNGAQGPSRREMARLRKNGVKVRTEPLAEVCGGEALASLRFEGGAMLPCEALFVHAGQLPGSPLPGMLGCPEGNGGTVRVRANGATAVPGLYVAGDAAGEPQMILAAAASGARVATVINKALRQEKCG